MKLMVVYLVRYNSGMFSTVMLIYHLKLYFLRVSMDRAHFVKFLSFGVVEDAVEY